MRQYIFLLIVLFFLFQKGYCSLNIKEHSLEGTEFREDVLTDKQLGFQRYFAYLTFLQSKYDPSKNTTVHEWKGWEANVEDPQIRFGSLRYHLAFLSYAVGAMAYRTPAYTDVAVKIIEDCIERMLDKSVWEYVNLYWSKESFFPDPVVYENIMYSGHLAQMIAMYESLSGDFKYSRKGFDFVWDNETIIHYTTKKLMEVMYKQVEDESSGGISCEPDRVFVDCQNHPHLAFLLHDRIHNTSYSSLTPKWQNYMEQKAPETIPIYKRDRYLKILYLRKSHFWVPLGASGNDGWGLSWMFPWSSNLDFVCKGWGIMHNSSRWRVTPDGGMYISSDILEKMFKMDAVAGTSYYPLVEVQCNKAFPARSEKFQGVIKFFETFGKLLDTDGDGFSESYVYQTPEPEYKIWITSNMVTAMVISPNLLRTMYSEVFFRKYGIQPKITDVPYPKIQVPRAIYLENKKRLEFSFVTQNAQSVPDFLFKVNNVPDLGFKNITRNGKEISSEQYKYDQVSHTLEIHTSVDKDEQQSWMVQF